jgi:transposase-like protein
MKCDICKQEIEETFLHKIKGSYVKVEGKRKVVCKDCQSKYKEEIKSEL